MRTAVALLVVVAAAYAIVALRAWRLDRAWRRRAREDRRLDALGTVEAHRRARPRDLEDDV